jgi:hypothetical protein
LKAEISTSHCVAYRRDLLLVPLVDVSFPRWQIFPDCNHPTEDGSEEVNIWIHISQFMEKLESSHGYSNKYGTTYSNKYLKQTWKINHHHIWKND